MRTCALLAVASGLVFCSCQSRAPAASVPSPAGAASVASPLPTPAASVPPASPTAAASARSPSPAAAASLPSPAGTASVPPPSPTAAETPARAEEQAHGWPVLGDLRRHCEGQVLGVDGSEILWSGFISRRPPAEIAALYEKRLGSELLEKTAAEWTWRAPTVAAPSRALSVTGPRGPMPDQCRRLPAGTATVAILSVFLRTK